METTIHNVPRLICVTSPPTQTIASHASSQGSVVLIQLVNLEESLPMIPSLKAKRTSFWVAHAGSLVGWEEGDSVTEIWLDLGILDFGALGLLFDLFFFPLSSRAATSSAAKPERTARAGSEPPPARGTRRSTRTRKKNGTWDENEIFLMMIIGCGCGYGLLKRQADKWTGRTPSSCKRRRRRTSKYNKVFVSHQQQQNVRNHGYIDHSWRYQTYQRIDRSKDFMVLPKKSIFWFFSDT